MRNLYLKILVITCLLIGGPVLFAQFILDKNPLGSTRSLTDCSATIPSGGFTDGLECNEANGGIAANDIIVPEGSNLTLNSVMANMILEGGVTITSATIWIFYDEYGYPDRYPGYELTSQSVTPTSQTLINSDAGMDFYEVLWDLSPIFLEGYEEYYKRYWVGISATTSDGSTPLWEVSEGITIGQPAAFSTGSWFNIVSAGNDGSYTFFADCEPMTNGGDDGEITDCSAEVPSGGFTDGIECNEANGEIAANDIIVPEGSNLTLNSVMANMIVEEGATITSATIWIFYDDYGYPDRYPGYEHTSQSIVPTSQTLISSDAGQDFYEVLWDLSPIFLEGYEEYYRRYWVGISATTSDGSTPRWEFTGDNGIGQPAAYSTGSWFNILGAGNDGAYIFSADCAVMDNGGDDGAIDCSAEIPSGGFADGIDCNEANNEIAANDIIVPEGSNLTLNSVMANMILQEGVTITSATIWIFYDEYGYPDRYPGFEHTSQSIIPTSQTLVGSDAGLDFYEVLWDLSPIFLEGYEEYYRRYWVGISATTSDGSTPRWEVTVDNEIGQPAAYSTGSWFNILSAGNDGSYIFSADCAPISEGGDGETNCDVSIPTAGFEDALPCNAVYNYSVANDIIVPMGYDMTLNAIMANISISELGDSITSATIRIYADADGAPDASIEGEITSQILAPTSHTLLNTDAYGTAFYEVLWDLSPVALDGKLNADMRYWIALSVETSGQYVDAHWEVTDETMIGLPVFSSYGSGFQMQWGKDGVYTFFAECGPMDATDPVEDPGYECKTSLEADVDYTGDGQNCTYNTRIVANDIVVPAGSDKVLESVTPRLILNPNVVVDGVSINIYKDDNGVPGEVIFNDFVGATSHDLITTFDGKEVYDVLIELNSVFLTGSADAETVYWIGLSIMTSNGSYSYWEVTYENSSGHPTALKTGGNFIIPNVNQDGVYTFSAQCYEIGEYAGPNDGYCTFNDLDINQDADTDCFGNVKQGGFFQSFTAVQEELSGAGIKFTNATRGMEVTLSVWDGLSNQGGTMLATMSTHTYGGQWVDVFWDAPLELTPGEVYYLRIEGDDDLSCVRVSTDIYSGGQAYSAFQPYPDYDFTFRTYYCNDISCDQRDYGYTGAYEDGVLTSKDQSNLLATDIVVPVDEDFILESVKVVLWVMPGATITNADIVLYADNNGSPGALMNTMEEIPVHSQYYFGTHYGYDMYEVEFVIEPLKLFGNFGSFTTYWISLDVGTSNGSALISITSTGQLAYASYISPDNGVTWEELEGIETKHTFRGSCEPIDYYPCDDPQLEMEQLEGSDCIITVGYGAVAQSFTADSPLSAGAGIKFKAPSVGSEVSLAIWDDLPNAGGTMLVSKSTETSGQNWIELFWDQVIELTPGEVYYLVIAGSTNLPCIAGTTTSAYDGGHVYGNANDGFPPHPEFDFVFRTYSCVEIEDPYESTCMEENSTDFSFETGFQSSLFSNYLTANDITVPMGEDFTLTRITASFVTSTPIFYADVIYYEDNGGAPGEEIGNESSVQVLNQKVIGNRQGTDVYEAVFEVSPFLLEGLYDESVTYWISLRVATISHTDVYWLAESSTAQGYPTAQSENGGGWLYPNAQLDCIYNWEGNCTEIEEPVGIIHREISGFSFYPNPSNDIINLNSDESIESVAIYNVLGQLVIQRQINATYSTLDVSELTPGTYLMKVSVNGQIGTYKLMKI